MIEGAKPILLNGLGVPMEPKNNKTLLIDADTIAYKACVINQEVEQHLSRDFHTDEEWENLITDKSFDEVELTTTTCDLEASLERAVELIDRIKEVTGCDKVELHFTKGKQSFRYFILPDYKANRTNIKPVYGLGETKQALLDLYDGEIHTVAEADEIVVFKAKKQPEKYLLTFVDKDVGLSVEGRHFNCYESHHYNIDMRFVKVTKSQAYLWPYVQCLLGDTSDNIKGPYRVGIKSIPKILGKGKVSKADWDLQAAQYKDIGETKNTADVLVCLDNCDITLSKAELWDRVVKTYESKGLTEDDAFVNMNCVNMNCIVDYELNRYKFRTDSYAVRPWYTQDGKTCKGLLND